jgi:integrase
VSVAAVALDEARFPLKAWAGWLERQIDPNWRADEWDSGTLLFTGDPDNQNTGVYWCVTVACATATRTQGMCTECERTFRAGHLARDEFIATHVPSYKIQRAGRAKPRCNVRSGESQCGRPARARGLCYPHYGSWRQASARIPNLDFDQWLSTAQVHSSSAPESCLVDGCTEERQHSLGLCVNHAWKRRRSTEPFDQWLAAQTPALTARHFTLKPLQPLARLELLYVLQQRDIRGHKVVPAEVRMLVRNLTSVLHLVGMDRGQLRDLLVPAQRTNMTIYVNQIQSILQAGFDRMNGIEPTDKLIWDLNLVDVASDASPTGRRLNGGYFDFTVVAQPWLRSVLMQWAKNTDPPGHRIRGMLKAATIASNALERRPGGGHDQDCLGADDIDAVMRALFSAGPTDGSSYTARTRQQLAKLFLDLLDYGRRTGRLDKVPLAFSFNPAAHRAPKVESENEDLIGKAVPEYIIAQLDARIAELGKNYVYGAMTDEQVERMFQTAYVILRDTGRRPNEIASLRTNCVARDDGYTLTWDNHKTKRYGRRLPITTETAEVILDWLTIREQLDTPDHSATYLFPPKSPRSRLPHMRPQYIADVIRLWVKSLPAIHSDVVGPDGQPMPFDRSLIYPYAFRHAYAQRHADAGVPVDILRDLMDHVHSDVTMGYYKITLKRKREAVDLMSRLTVDRTGSPVATPPDAYELRSVAVPFGNCIEPSNVKAGGQACPIRFQCSGCSFYRPDPSYLPAIDEHVNSLRADKETALAIGADDFVIRNFSDQISSFDQVRDKMRESLVKMEPAERERIEEAGAVLRKARAAQVRTPLPLTPIHRNQERRNG